MTTAAPPRLSLEGIDAALTEHLFGWRWYTLSPTGIEQAEISSLTDGQDRRHLLHGERFLADAKYGELQVELGRFRHAGGSETIAEHYEKHVLPIHLNAGLAIVALQKCGYVQYCKARSQSGKYAGESHRVSCSREMLASSLIGKGEAETFAEAAARAVAIAWGLTT